MLMRKKRSTIFGGVLCCVLAASAAFAADVNYYTGAFCTFSASDAYNGQSRNLPKFGNTSGSTRNAVCPLMSDAQTDVEQATIWASPSVDEDTCVFRVRSKDGTYIGFWTHDTVTATGSGMNRTDFFAGTAFLDTLNGDTYTISCDLPNQAIITGYDLYEK